MADKKATRESYGQALAELGEKYTKIRLIPLSNWGDGEETKVVSFDFN